ncbi:UvrD-helicase domain-containing protein [Rubellimicrobium roseum]|uniref:UvrD-like helicase ATP-binding domain-containing protein n=1 Tax=Rubellimicrobium roseum TaxID=687525 RepID=A0A5C4NEZ0_9RHOB|nr:UvrD-helicase domain-containing protein [Rubellimicrobium roseum]TNC69812.1 hypothetical protein FHG71_13410 [Rubellimicrobium roseum]
MPPARPAELTLTSDDFPEWKALWDRSIDRSKWIRAGTAARLLSSYSYPGTNIIRSSQFERSRNSIQKALDAEFAAANVTFMPAQKERLRPFFATVEKNPLTDEQAEACICMDAADQIVAAAGSGKTSTLVAKTGYLLLEGLAKPEEILLLAFNATAARELAERLGSGPVSALAFQRLS